MQTGPTIGVIQNYNNYHIEFKNMGKESMNSANHTNNDLSNEDIQSIERILINNNSNQKQQQQMNSTRQTINNIN